MAIRNSSAIDRLSEQRSRELTNKKNADRDYVWNRIHKILQLREQAEDVVDTFDALCNKGLRSKVDAFQANQKIKFVYQYKGLQIGDALGEHCCIRFEPKENNVHFAWSGHGMCECYDSYRVANGSAKDEVFVFYILGKNRTYNQLLDEMVATLEPYLDAAFLWIDSL